MKAKAKDLILKIIQKETIKAGYSDEGGKWTSDYLFVMCIIQFFRTMTHKFLVMVAGVRLGGIPFWRLLVHDWQKFLPVELRGYAEKYCSTYWYRNEEVMRAYGDHGIVEAAPFGYLADDRYKLAWHHHKNSAPHHYQYWIGCDGAFTMPDTYVREMVADLMASGRQYTGDWNMQEWLDKNNAAINALCTHGTSVKIQAVLEELGYKWSCPE